MNIWTIVIVAVILSLLPIFKPIRYFLSKHRITTGFIFSLSATFLGVYLSMHLSSLEERERVNAHAQEILEKIKATSISLYRSSGRYALFPKSGEDSYYDTLQPSRIRGYLGLDEAKLEFSSKYLITMNNILDTLEGSISLSRSDSFNLDNSESLYKLIKMRTQEIVFLTELESAYKLGVLGESEFEVFYDCHAEPYNLPIKASYYATAGCGEKIKKAISSLPKQVNEELMKLEDTE